MDEFGVRPLCPTPRGGVDLIWKDADGNRDGDVLRGEKGKLVFPIQTSRRDRRVRQPVEGDVVENVISRKALGLTGKDARHERLTGFVMVEYPGRQAVMSAPQSPPCATNFLYPKQFISTTQARAMRSGSHPGVVGLPENP
jgi:hypothetical protein